jgi:glycerophosphoryl diester phosphodiesterase
MKIIGHRGAKGLEPENTLASFKKALEHRADELEFDLRVTSDGVVVLNHNAYITDPADNKLSVVSHTFAELRKHKPDLLTLEALFAAMDSSVHLLIEVKPHVATMPIIKLIKHELAGGRPEGNLSIGSFDQSILRAMHRAFPGIEMVVIERWSGVRGSLRARQVGTKRLNMRSWWLWRGFLHSMHRHGYQIAAYTMNNPAKVRRWQPYLYGVITDYPNRFRK